MEEQVSERRFTCDRRRGDRRRPEGRCRVFRIVAVIVVPAGAGEQTARGGAHPRRCASDTRLASGKPQFHSCSPLTRSPMRCARRARPSTR